MIKASAPYFQVRSITLGPIAKATTTAITAIAAGGGLSGSALMMCKSAFPAQNPLEAKVTYLSGASSSFGVSRRNSAGNTALMTMTIRMIEY